MMGKMNLKSPICISKICEYNLLTCFYVLYFNAVMVRQWCRHPSACFHSYVYVYSYVPELCPTNMACLWVLPPVRLVLMLSAVSFAWLTLFPVVTSYGLFRLSKLLFLVCVCVSHRLLVGMAITSLCLWRRGLIWVRTRLSMTMSLVPLQDIAITCGQLVYLSLCVTLGFMIACWFQWAWCECL